MVDDLRAHLDAAAEELLRNTQLDRTEKIQALQCELLVMLTERHEVANKLLEKIRYGVKNLRGEVKGVRAELQELRRFWQASLVSEDPAARERLMDALRRGDLVSAAELEEAEEPQEGDRS